jgi:hypothetical protein
LGFFFSTSESETDLLSTGEPDFDLDLDLLEREPDRDFFFDTFLIEPSEPAGLQCFDFGDPE